MSAIQTTKIYQYLTEAVEQGYTVISEQGGARSSKTYNTVIFFVVYLLQHPGTRLSIVRATLPALKGSVYRDFEEIMRKMGCNGQKLGYNTFIGICLSCLKKPNINILAIFLGTELDKI